MFFSWENNKFKCVDKIENRSEQEKKKNGVIHGTNLNDNVNLFERKMI